MADYRPDGRCVKCDGKDLPEDTPAKRTLVRPCTCAPVHRACFYRTANMTYRFSMMRLPIATHCDTCGTMYAFKYPFFRAAASFAPLVTIPAGYGVAYAGAIVAGGMLGVGPAPILGAALAAGALWFAARYTHDPRVTVKGRTVGPMGAIALGALFTSLSPVLGAVELQDRIMRPFTLIDDPLSSW